MRKIAVILLLMVVICMSGFAETIEASSRWQEFDITFWQTFPFATIFGYIIERQLSVLMFPGQEARWEVIFPFAAAVSALNAFLHTQRRMEHERAGSDHPDNIR